MDMTPIETPFTQAQGDLLYRQMKGVIKTLTGLCWLQGAALFALVYLLVR